LDELSWKVVLHLLVVTALLVGVSILLLVYSLSGDEKCIEILLLIFGRLLIITQVGSIAKLIKVY
jgi:hypothetical protein